MKQSELLKYCYSKKKYKNVDEANLAGLHRMKVFKEKQLYYYLCNNCNNFHLTHKLSKYRVI